MNELEAVKLLDYLAELRAQQDALRLEWEQLRDTILAPLRPELDALDTEYQPRLNAVVDAITSVETNVRQQVLAVGASVKGAHLHAVLMSGRVSWDSKGLDGYAVAHPEIERFRKQGEPSVTIRK
jgi:hypothetical protein